MTAAEKRQTLDDLLALPPEVRAELIDGQIVYKAMSGGEHGGLTARVLGQVESRFNKKRGSNGSGGWWIANDVTVRFRRLERILRPDIVGWRRDRVAERPKGYPVEARPDWVCEISHATLKKDSTIVPETLAAEGVDHYWLVDVERETLQVFRLVEGLGHYALIKTYFRDDGDARIEPFDVVPLNLGVLFGDDPE